MMKHVGWVIAKAVGLMLLGGMLSVQTASGQRAAPALTQGRLDQTVLPILDSGTLHSALIELTPGPDGARKWSMDAKNRSAARRAAVAAAFS